MTKELKLFFSIDDIYIIYSALNEICNILDIPDFEIRIGETEEAAAEVMNKIGVIYEANKNVNYYNQTIDLPADEFYLIYIALTEICYGFEIPEFELRIGYSVETVTQLHTRLKNIYRSLENT